MNLIAENDYFTEPEMCLLVGLTASLLLHLAVLTTFNPAPPAAGFGQGALRAVLKGASEGRESEQNGSGTALQSTVAPVTQAVKSSQAADRPHVESAAPAAAASSGDAGTSYGSGYYGRAIVMGNFDVAGITGVPALANPDFVAINHLAPKPSLPPGFNISYPESAKATARRASVKLAVFLDESGRVVEVLVLEEDPPGNLFADAAVGTLRNTRFQPGSVGGRPVKSKLIMRVQFGFE